MIYYLLVKDSKAIEISTKAPPTQTIFFNNIKWITRHDFSSLEQVENFCDDLNEVDNVKYLPVDKGEHTSPRYDIIKAPKIGDLVSKYFNGDSYPEGEIVSISKSFRTVTTSTGVRFHRKKKTSSWFNHGTWFMGIGQHVYSQNPSF